MKRTKTYCSDCDYDTNQTILYSTRTVQDEGTETYMVVKCLGCNDVSFVLRLRGKGFEDGERNIAYLDLNYPEGRPSGDIVALDFEETIKLPKMIGELYEEVITAFQHDSRILAGIGLRMLVEGICIQQQIAGSNLKAKIQAMHESRLISRNEAPILDKLREIGNMSAHEIKGLTIKKLKYALEIINHVLKSIYILPSIHKKLKL